MSLMKHRVRYTFNVDYCYVRVRARVRTLCTLLRGKIFLQNVFKLQKYELDARDIFS
jgi:hypothetical protein